MNLSAYPMWVTKMKMKSCPRRPIDEFSKVYNYIHKEINMWAVAYILMTQLNHVMFLTNRNHIILT